MDYVNKADSNKLRHFVYNYKLDGNISSKIETISGFNDTVTYTYDSTGRLSSENYEGYNNFNVAYTYDASGNRKTASYTGDIVTRTENYTYDLNNRLTQIFTENRYKSYNNVTDISYDKNGNQLRVDKYTKNKTGAFKIAVTDAYNRYSGTSSEEFTYNGLKFICTCCSSGNACVGLVTSSAANIAGNVAKFSSSNNSTTSPYNWGNGQSADDVINKANHIFHNKRHDHNLDELLKKYNGDEIGAYKDITDAAQGMVDRKGITNNNFNEVIKLKGYNITVDGAIINGKVRVKTAYIP